MCIASPRVIAMSMEHVTRYLDEHDVKYVIMQHSPAFTAQEIAEAVHVSGRHFAKSVVVKIDGRLALAVLPASDQVDLPRLTQSVGASTIELATEDEFKDRLPDCDVGAMPPFGNLFEMEVFVSPHLTASDLIAFNACTHTDVLQLPYATFARLVNPIEVAL